MTREETQEELKGSDTGKDLAVLSVSMADLTEQTKEQIVTASQVERTEKYAVFSSDISGAKIVPHLKNPDDIIKLSENREAVKSVKLLHGKRN